MIQGETSAGYIVEASQLNGNSASIKYFPVKTKRYVPASKTGRQKQDGLNDTSFILALDVKATACQYRGMVLASCQIWWVGAVE